MVPPPRIELEIMAYQATVIPFNYRGLWMREMDSNHRSLAYEASEFPLLYPAIVWWR